MAVMSEAHTLLFLPAGLYLALALAALVLTALRRPRAGVRIRSLLVAWLFAIACQSLHLTEEYITGFHEQMPDWLGLGAWSPRTLLLLNLVGMALWTLSVLGVAARLRIAWFPLWFFALAMMADGLWHPVLAVAGGGYFPGTVTALLVAVVGGVVTRRAWVATQPSVLPWHRIALD